MWGINLKSNKTLFKSIFSKYFTATAVLISLAFVLTSVIQLVFARRYWIDEKQVLLETQVEQVSSFVADSAIKDDKGDYKSAHKAYGRQSKNKGSNGTLVNRGINIIWSLWNMAICN